ncbi:hypothetical protein [Streptomyces sp. NPDC093591]|uniref:hypothetical protein n=1 Tax=Streptomyces sp. NPDC093591 TaxID=3366044 RepID=UPI00382D73B9
MSDHLSIAGLLSGGNRELLIDLSGDLFLLVIGKIGSWVQPEFCPTLFLEFPCEFGSLLIRWVGPVWGAVVHRCVGQTFTQQI